MLRYWPSPGLYPATLTEQTSPLKDLIYEFRGNFSCGTQRVVPSVKIARAILPARLANHSVGGANGKDGFHLSNAKRNSRQNQMNQ